LFSKLLVVHTLFFFVTSSCRKHEVCYRFLPRLHEELRRNSYNWGKLLTYTQLQSKFSFSPEELTIHVVSPERVRHRSIHTQLSLQSQGISFTIANGVDGLQPFNSSLVEIYAGHKRQKYLKQLEQKSSEELHILYAATSADISTEVKFALHERLRFACYLSHVLQWELAHQKQLPLLVVLEDDVIIESNFTSELLGVLRDLPSSWGLLHLNGCYKKLGPAFGHRSRQSRGGLCTYGYAISASGIRKLLTGSALESNKPIDHMIEEEIASGRLIAFHAEPSLIRQVQGLSSL
jgi:GR25 family glycosyltransferase involved in LPS biosynthesis